jgi:hypothetical protein
MPYSQMTKEELIHLEELSARATPGPWRSFVEGRDHESGSDFIRTDRSDIELSGASTADQDFIAAAGEAVPRLIAEIRRLRETGLVERCSR